jgi:hypothetical protein
MLQQPRSQEETPMHKNTRSILGNPSQQGKKTHPNPLLYYSTERPSPTNYRFSWYNIK